jgi:Protein of unknown function (DUF3307)
MSDTLALTAIALIGAHCFFDYAGQGDFMSKAKNSTVPIPGVPWQTILAAHCAIHGAAVALITGIWWLFLLEAVAHWITDNAKCQNKISFNVDQVIHLACKALWLSIWWLKETYP